MSDRFDSTVTTTCGYCGVGCRLEAHARDGRIASISPAQDGPANRGHTCLKGRFAHQFSRNRDRLTAPLIREHGGFRIATWEEALHKISTELNRIKGQYGPDAIAGLASSRATNEDCYAMQRLMRAAIGTNNIDNCSRVCHSPTSFALRKSLGPVGRDRLVQRHRRRRRRDHHRREPDRGPPRRRRADQAGDAQGTEARHDRPAPDRAGRLRRAPPRAEARHERRRDARPRHVAARDGLTDPASSHNARRATKRSRRCSRITRRSRPRRSRGSRRRTSSERPTSTARPRTPRSCGASASPSTSTAPRSCG